MQQDNKLGLKIFVFSVIVFVSMFIMKKIQEDRIQLEGVYQIAVVFEKGNAKNGTQYRFKYVYRGETFSATYKSSGMDSFFLIKLLPKKPKVWMVIDDKLPQCLNRASFSDTGWKELPNCK